MDPLKIFISYCHKDESIKETLEVHLSQLKRDGLISVCHDRLTPVGGELYSEISKYIEEADIFLFLVGPHFIDSSYCQDIEMKRAIERYERGEAEVVPIIIDPCDWKNTELSRFAVAPTDGKPISKHVNKHEAFLEVSEKLRSLCSSVLKGERKSDKDKHETKETLPLKSLKNGYELYHDFDLLSSDERYILSFSSKPGGTSWKGIQKVLAIPGERFRRCVDRLVREELIEENIVDGEKVWKLSEAGKEFMENNLGALWV